MIFETITYLCVALIAAGGSWSIALWAHRNLRILALPNARSLHTVPTPSGGGIAIAFAFWLGLTALYVTARLESDLYIALLVGSVVLVSVGLIDDIFEIKRRWRLFFQVAAASWAVYCLGGLPPWLTLWWLQHLLTVIALVWLINLYNFMDGIDGLAASEAIYTALAILLIAQGLTDTVSVLLLLAAACTGFLFLNWPPARIFMGDCGSYLLAYVLGTCSLVGVKTQLLTSWTVFILLAVFIVDATYTLLYRMSRRACWYEPHRSHAYQKAAQRFGSHAIVTVMMLLLNVMWLMPWAWLSVKKPEWGAGFFILAILPLLFLANRLGAGDEQVKIY